MKLKLKREIKEANYTVGSLYINDKYECKTVEYTDRGLSDNMPENEINSKKVYGQTAIPTGTYRIDMSTISLRLKDRSWAKPYGGKLPRLIGVKGFDGLLIHPVNKAEESLGCIGPNESVNKGIGSNSVKAFNKIMLALLEAKAKGENITIEIV